MLKHQEQLQQSTTPSEHWQVDTADTTDTTPSAPISASISARVEDVSEPITLFPSTSGQTQQTVRWPRRALNAWQQWKGWQRGTAAAGAFISLVATIASLQLPSSQATTSVNNEATMTHESGQWQPLTPDTASSLPRSAWVVSHMTQGVDYFVSRDELYQVSHRISTAQIPVELTRDDLKPSSKQWRVTIQGMDMVLHGYSRMDANQKMVDFTSVKVNNDQHPVEVSVWRLKNSPVRATLLDQSDAETNAGVVETLSIPPATAKAH